MNLMHKNIFDLSFKIPFDNDIQYFDSVCIKKEKLMKSQILKLINHKKQFKRSQEIKEPQGKVIKCTWVFEPKKKPKIGKRALKRGIYYNYYIPPYFQPKSKCVLKYSQKCTKCVTLTLPYFLKIIQKGLVKVKILKR